MSNLTDKQRDVAEALIDILGYPRDGHKITGDVNSRYTYKTGQISFTGRLCGEKASKVNFRKSTLSLMVIRVPFVVFHTVYQRRRYLIKMSATLT